MNGNSTPQTAKSNNTEYSFNKIMPKEEVQNNNFEGGNMEVHTTSQTTVKSVEKLEVVSNQIVIHVYDETNQINKDFMCSRDLLLQQMKYFRPYLNDKSSCDEVDIAVHCDVNIFQWLMNYMVLPHSEAQAVFSKLEVPWAISILISSFFLGMSELVQQTVTFVSEKLQEIINLPIELDCMNEELIGKLSERFTDEELENICDRKDKIISRLFQQKLEQLLTLDDKSNTLFLSLITIIS